MLWKGLKNLSFTARSLILTEHSGDLRVKQMSYLFCCEIKKETYT